jgi:hypothetical protein
MHDEKSKWTSVSIRPTHGTARLINHPSVLAQDKREKEVFWVRALVAKLPEFSCIATKIRPNEDDSHGNHDVIIEMQKDCSIGVQVTELTFELRRKREAIRASYLKKVIDLLVKENVTSEERVLVKLLFNSPDPEELNLEKPERIVQVIENEDSINEQRSIESGRHHILFEKIGENDFYVPNVNNIGVDVDFDQVPRSLGTYKKATKYLFEKKSRSISPWLLVWSLDFWRDKHTFGKSVLENMRTVFANAGFDKIYFLESLDGNGLFEANIGLHIIKE